MEYLETIGRNAKQAAKAAAKMSTDIKNSVLAISAKALTDNAAYILEENAKDIINAEAAGIKPALIDRLSLNEKRIAGMAQGLTDVAALPDPVGEFFNMRTFPNGLTVGQKRVPMGVIGIIYESRPNVTTDAFGLCLKAGSAVILRGGKEAIRSNAAIIAVIRRVLSENGYDANLVQLIDDTSREITTQFMRLNKYVDVLIPRGGGGLIQSVIENSTIPVIETGIGNCHIFVDETADLKNAVDIIINAKTQRPGVCNACEKVLIHKKVAAEFLPVICEELRAHDVEIRGDEHVTAAVSFAVPADETDWYTEYLDYIIGIKLVDGVDEAIAHIGEYSSGHSEAILTNSYANSQQFLNEVDSAAVYVNASTRFTDGMEFGLGAEIGISTQKLHARGPMGLKELTSAKYIIYGNGQIRG